MAAPSVFTRGLQLQRLFTQLKVPPAVVACQLQQVCYKGTGRSKAPPEDTGSDKWVPRTEKIKKKQLPKNWAEKVLSRVPQDDVWFRAFYARPLHSIEQALVSHCELAQPAMTDNMEGLVHLDCQLDFRTKKKTKFVAGIKKTVILPHPFDDGSENRVLAFCKTQEEKEAALAWGATFAGGIELVKAIEKGEIRGEDWDHVVSTIEMIGDLAKIRKPLRDQFPHKQKGNIGEDIAQLVHHFSNGKTYESTKEEDAVGLVRVTLGKLNMPLEHLVENFRTYVEEISAQQKASQGGRFIKSALLVCPPSPERFQIDPSELAPKSRKKAPKTQEPESDDEPEPVANAEEDSDDEGQKVANK